MLPSRHAEGTIQTLISLPEGMAREFARLEGRPSPAWFAGHDPAGRRLGSGGGTVHLLVEAWRGTGAGQSFAAWLRAGQKLVVHGGGESRRLPAYAAVGKPLMPMPVLRWSRGQRLDQTLLDLQWPEYRRVLNHAGPGVRLMIASGDVLLRFAENLPPFPPVDVIGLGMWLTPERAQDHGVFFVPRQQPGALSFFLQKPSPARIRELAMEYVCLVDTGMWLLSERAVAVLLARSGWRADSESFAGGTAAPYEFYSQFALGLGAQPTVPDTETSALSCGVVPLPEPEFYHFGASRQMIESISALQNRELDQIKLGLVGAKRHLDQYLQNCRYDPPLRQERNHTLWVENSVIPATWQLASDHVLTGVPENAWDLPLEPGVCLDFVPVGEQDLCVRFYGMADPFRGALSAPDTRWLGRPASEWAAARGLSWEALGQDPAADIQFAALFPVWRPDEVDPCWLQWMFARQPVASPEFASRFLRARRLSARGISAGANLERVYRQRAANRAACLRPLLQNSRWSVFLRLDLEATGGQYAATAESLPPVTPEADADALDPMRRVHELMFHSAVRRHRGEVGWEDSEKRAFACLREMIIREAQLSPVAPRCDVQEDQIVWGRSPVRLDLAGGWSDTPPYCLEQGGSVVNVGVDLNGQPPIQVFAKLSPKPELAMRSIDLGAEQRVATYEELATFAQPGSEFAVAKAAFALAGFLPRFHAAGGFPTLRAQLEDFGGGIEISLLSAVPKGSGLGTSSILAATLLGTLSDLCGLAWDRSVLFSRTLALEQMLTTGGGWQDQAGGLFRGIKSIETASGLAQRPTLRWLPDHLFSPAFANRSMLLYYTGLTRLAKNILQEIVRGMFLNSPAHLAVVKDIAANATTAFHALQRLDYPALAVAVRSSWDLNQRLDAGTNPPPVAAILAQVEDYLLSAKLLGAGGGGYFLMLAKDEEAARRARASLEARPPNARARFVEFRLSDTGLQLTRS